MFVAGNARENLVIAVDANDPIDTGNENREKHFERRDAESLLRLQKFGMARDGDSLPHKSGECEKVANPELRHRGTSDGGGRIVGSFNHGFFLSKLLFTILSFFLRFASRAFLG